MKTGCIHFGLGIASILGHLRGNYEWLDEPTFFFDELGNRVDYFNEVRVGANEDFLSIQPAFSRAGTFTITVEDTVSGKSETRDVVVLPGECGPIPAEKQEFEFEIENL